MIQALYPPFRKWSENGGVYIISDTHFEDPHCKLMDPGWISPEEQVSLLRRRAGRGSTLVHLGDVGNPEWMRGLRCRKVLVMGNHDQGRTNFEPYFDEVYDGPVLVADRILLSHEPVAGLEWCLNIHGHDHAGVFPDDGRHINMAANVCGYAPIELGALLKSGALSGIPSIHRITIDGATERKRSRLGRG